MAPGSPQSAAHLPLALALELSDVERECRAMQDKAEATLLPVRASHPFACPPLLTAVSPYPSHRVAPAPLLQPPPFQLPLSPWLPPRPPPPALPSL